MLGFGEREVCMLCFLFWLDSKSRRGMDGGIICGTCDSISQKTLRLNPREMPVNSKGSWTLQGRDKIIPATRVEKASRLQLKELREINKDRESSISFTGVYFRQWNAKYEVKLLVAGWGEGGRKDSTLLVPGWQKPLQGSTGCLQGLGILDLSRRDAPAMALLLLGVCSAVCWVLLSCLRWFDLTELG